jgi:hypothetical protein
LLTDLLKQEAAHNAGPYVKAPQELEGGMGTQTKSFTVVCAGNDEQGKNMAGLNNFSRSQSVKVVPRCQYRQYLALPWTLVVQCLEGEHWFGV